MVYYNFWAQANKLLALFSLGKKLYLSIEQGYTCRIAVGIPKTAIGVTAILLTAISETAMAAKN